MEKTFRTSMFGFNKEDVAKYIYQQDKVYEKKLAEKNAALEEANTARKNAEQNARDWEKNNEKIKDLQSLLKRFRDLSEFLHVSIEEDDTAMDAV